MSLDSTKICSNEDIYNLIEMQNSQTLQKAASEFCQTLEKYKVGMPKALFRRFVCQTLFASNNMMNERMQSQPSLASIQDVASEQAHHSFSCIIENHPIEIGSIQADSAEIKVASSASLKQEDKLATFSQKNINHEQSLQQSHSSKNVQEKSLPPITLIMKRLNQLNQFSKKILQGSNKIQSDVIMIQLIEETRLAEMDSPEQKEEIIQRLFDCIKTAENQASVIKNQVSQAVQYHKDISQQISRLSSDSQAEQEVQWKNIQREAADNYGELIIQKLKSNFQATINKIRKGKQILDNFSSKIKQQKLAHKQHETNKPYNQSSKDHYDFPSLQPQNLMQFAQNQPQGQIIPTTVEQSFQLIINSAKMAQKFAQITVQCVNNIEKSRRTVEKIAKLPSKSNSETQINMKKINITIRDTQLYLKNAKQYSIHAEEAFKQILNQRMKVSAYLYSTKYDWTEELFQAEIVAEKAKNIAAQNYERATLTVQHVLESARGAQIFFKRRTLPPNPANTQEKSLQKQTYQKVQKQHVQAQKNQQNRPYFNRVEGVSSPIAKTTKTEDKIKF